MLTNRMLHFALLLSGLFLASSSHAMFLQRAMQRSGTKYATQLAQSTQKRFFNAHDLKMITESLDGIANELKKNNANTESLLKRIHTLENKEHGLTSSDLDHLKILAHKNIRIQGHLGNYSGKTDLVMYLEDKK